MPKKKTILVTILVLAFGLTATAAFASMTFDTNTITGSGSLNLNPTGQPVTINGDLTVTGSCTGCGSAGAPTDATYITQTPNGTLSNEQALSALGTGLALNTTTTGVLSIYAGTSCTNQFVRSLNASGAATCASVALGSDVSGTLPATNLVGTDIATVGTITSGVWHGTAVAFGFGGTGLTSAADDTVMVSTGSAWAAKAVVDCTDTSGNHLNYTASTNSFSCGTSSSASGGDASTNTSSSVANEVTVFANTSGKLLARATGTGFAKLTSGVLSTVSSISESDLGLTDVTTADATTSAHGFLKKLDNVATHFLDGTGNWSTPGGGADYSGSGNPQGVQTATGGQTYRDTSNGVLYQKLSAASSNTGWYRELPTAGPSLSALPFQPFYVTTQNGSAQSGFGGPQLASATTIFNETGVSGSSTYEADGLYRYGTTTSSGNNVGWYANDFSGSNQTWDQDFDIVFHVKSDPSSTATMRYFIGLANANPTGDDPGDKFIGFRYATAASDGGWVGVTRSTSVNVTSTVASIATNTVYTLRMRKISGTVYFSVNDGAEVSTSTQVPSGSNKPFFIMYVQSTAGGTRGLKWQSMSGIRGLIGS